MANHGYYIRTSGQDYWELTSVKLPKACKISSKDKLYPIEVVETDGSRARIHHIGYGDSNDEWCDLSELVTIPIRFRVIKGVVVIVVMPQYTYQFNNTACIMNLE